MPRDLSARARACLTTWVFCPVSEDYSEQATTGAGQGAKKEGTVAGDRGEADELWQSRNPPPPQPA